MRSMRCWWTKQLDFRRLGAGALALAMLSACSGLNADKDSDSSSGGEADTPVSIAANDSTTAKIDPNSSETQVVEGEAGTDLEGTRLEIPPNALDGATPESEVKVTHGIDVATDVTGSYLTLPGSVTPATVPADIAADSGVSVAEQLFITLPIRVDPNQWSVQLADPSNRMAIFYVREHGFGLGLAAETGALPGNLITVAEDRQSVRFPVSFFGMFQVGFVDEAILEPSSRPGTPDFSSGGGTTTSGEGTSGDSTAGTTGGETGAGGETDGGTTTAGGDVGERVLVHYRPDTLPAGENNSVGIWADSETGDGAHPLSPVGFGVNAPVMREVSITQGGSATNVRTAAFDGTSNCFGHTLSHSGSMTMQISFGLDVDIGLASDGDQFVLFSIFDDGAAPQERTTVWLYVESNDLHLAVASGAEPSDIATFGSVLSLDVYFNPLGQSNALTLSIDSDGDGNLGRIGMVSFNGQEYTSDNISNNVNGFSQLSSAPSKATLGCRTEMGNDNIQGSMNGWIGEFKLWNYQLDNDTVSAEARDFEALWEP